MAAGKGHIFLCSHNSGIKREKKPVYILVVNSTSMLKNLCP